MRFEIQQTRWGRPRYTIHLGDVTVPVRNVSPLKRSKDRERMVFAWPDRGECTVRGPNPLVGGREIVSPEGKVWSGMPVDPRFRKKLPRPEIFLWHREDRGISCEARRLGCRTFFPIEVVLALREWDGRWLATWLNHRSLRGNLREDLSEDMKPVVLGMVLSSVVDWD